MGCVDNYTIHGQKTTMKMPKISRMQLICSIAFLVPMLVNAAPSNNEKDMKGPVFTNEPLNKVDFSNSTGAVVECRASGLPPPEIIWVRSDGTAVGDVPGLRQVKLNLQKLSQNI